MKPIFIKASFVARALHRLREQKTHTLFAGYLHLKQRSIEQQGRLDNLTPDFQAFYRKFFEVPNHPLGSPYIKIFIEQIPSQQNLWLNENVAGSYAPSSLRPNQPFRQVVNIQNKEYSLPIEHAQLAYEHLLYNKRVSAIDLAIVLYREYGFLKDSFSVEDLVDIFTYEFGYSNEISGKKGSGSIGGDGLSQRPGLSHFSEGNPNAICLPTLIALPIAETPRHLQLNHYPRFQSFWQIHAIPSKSFSMLCETRRFGLYYHPRPQYRREQISLPSVSSQLT